MQIDNKEIAKKLTKARKENYLSKKELAEKSGIDIDIIEQYEEGLENDLDINILEKLSDNLNIEITKLKGWKGNSLGEIIKYRRKELGMTQKDVANYVDVSHSAVSRWESGEIENITQDKIANLADILQISPLNLIAPDSDDSLYQLSQDYLDVAKKLQLLKVPIDICEQIIDIIEKLQKN